MAATSNNQVLEQLKWRYAVKKFDPSKKISKADWETLEEALVLSPSSYGLQPWKFLVIDKPEIRKKLTPLSWNQTQVEDCSHYVVFLGKTAVNESYVDNFIASAAKARGVTPDKLAGYRNMMVKDLVSGPRSHVISEWAARQVYIALGNLMTCAALLGIDACPMEGLEPPKYDEVLGLKDSGYVTLVACAFGYRHADDAYAKAPKVRFDKNQIIQHV